MFFVILLISFFTSTESCKECPFNGSWDMVINNTKCTEDKFVLFSKKVEFYQIDKLYIVSVEDWISCSKDIFITVFSKGSFDKYYTFDSHYRKYINIRFDLVNCQIQVYRKNISMNFNPDWKNEACNLNLEFQIEKNCQKMYISGHKYIRSF